MTTENVFEKEVEASNEGFNEMEGERNMKKEKEIEKLKSKHDYELFKALHPKKEGKKNYAKLSQLEKWEIEEEHPRFRKDDDGHWVYRSYIGYFPEYSDENADDNKYNKYSIVSTYNRIADPFIGILVVASCIGAAVVAYKAMKKFLNERR